LKIENVRANSAQYVFRGRQVAVENLQYDAPTQGYFTPECVQLASAYGRYHRCAFGQVIENRPADNRFQDEKK